MMTGNGADIECYADRENQPVQMAVRFWIARNSQLQAIQRAELFRQSAFLLFEIAFNAVTNILGDFQRVCNQVNHLIPTRVLVKGGEITCKMLK